MFPPPGKHWQYTPETLDEMDARGEIYWSLNSNPRRKVYLDNSPGKPIQDIWLDMRDAHNQNVEITGYPTEKNPDLLARIIEASSDPDDIVLDCFSGSGTTLAVAEKLGRRWIGVDNSYQAIVTTLGRFATGTQPMGDFVNGGKVDEKVGILQRTLFDLDGLNTKVVQKNPTSGMNHHLRITNFSLFSKTELASDLAEAINHWIEGITQDAKESTYQSSG
jgi:adenine-specific DNA-methyltransferase